MNREMNRDIRFVNDHIQEMDEWLMVGSIDERWIQQRKPLLSSYPPSKATATLPLAQFINMRVN